MRWVEDEDLVHPQIRPLFLRAGHFYASLHEEVFIEPSLCGRGVDTTHADDKLTST